MAVLGVLVGTAVASARVSIRASQNRIVLRRAGWARDGCLALLLANAARTGVVEPLDSIDLGYAAWCRAEVQRDGSKLNLNLATAGQLRLVLGREELVSSLLDWRDPDHVERTDGAERSWYHNAGRPGPRNAALRSVDELALVRGFEPSLIARLRPMITLQGRGTISLKDAPLEVLAGLPGMTANALSAIRDARLAGVSIRSLDDLLARLPASERPALSSSYADLVAATADDGTFDVRIEGHIGSHAMSATARVLLSRSGDAYAVTAMEIN